MTITTVGYGDIAATNITETVILIFLMAVGAAVWALVLGNAGTIAMGLDIEGVKHRRNMDELNQFFRDRTIPKPLQVAT